MLLHFERVDQVPTQVAPGVCYVTRDGVDGSAVIHFVSRDGGEVHAVGHLAVGGDPIISGNDVVPDIAGRDTLTPVSGTIVTVLNAIGDTDNAWIGNKTASYIWDGTAWIVLAVSDDGSITIEPYYYLDHGMGYISHPNGGYGSGEDSDNYIIYDTAVTTPILIKTDISVDVYITYIDNQHAVRHTTVRVSGHLSDDGWASTVRATYLNNAPTTNVRVYVGVSSGHNYRLILRVEPPINCKHISSRISDITYRNVNGIDDTALLNWRSKHTIELPEGGVIDATVDLTTTDWGAASVPSVVLPKNLLTDSGRFLHGEPPYATNQDRAELDAAFDPSFVIATYNGSSFGAVPGYVHDTSTYGGSGDALTGVAERLMIVTHMDGKLYQTPFNMCLIASGLGSNPYVGVDQIDFAHSSTGNKAWAQSVAAIHVGTQYTAGYWLYAENGECTVLATHKDGVVLNNGALTEVIVNEGNGWVHIAQIITDCNGLASPFTVFQEPGLSNRTIIALPYVTNNIVELTPTTHKGAIPGNI